jgi:hypothetical protein
MGSMIVDLQKSLLDPEQDIQNLLRRAQVIVHKLGISDSNNWIQYELEGYEGVAENEIPNYRILYGRLWMHNPMRGWIPFLMDNNEMENMLSRRVVTSPISELNALSSQKADGTIGYYLPDEFSRKLCQLAHTPVLMQCAVHLGKHQVNSIVERVRNRLFNLTIELENQGILGEGLYFSDKEADAAKMLSPSISNYYGNVVQGNVTGSQMVSGKNNTSEFNYNSLNDAVKEMKNQIGNEIIQQDDKDQIIELIGEIEKKIADKKKPGIIKAALIGLKDFSISAGANIIAAIVTNQLFPGS